MSHFRKAIVLLIVLFLAILMCSGCKKTPINTDDYVIQAKRYCSAMHLDYSFESKEIVPVDKLINYFCIYELTDENGYFKECYNECKQDYPNITIPKNIVNNRLEELFDVEIDDSESAWISKVDESCYYLPIMTRGGLDVPRITEENVSVKKGRVILECKVTYNILVDEVGYVTEEKNTYLKFEMKKTENGDIKILSCKAGSTD